MTDLDSSLSFAEHIFNETAAVDHLIAQIKLLLEKDIDGVTFSREMLTELVTCLSGSNKIVKELYEENQHILDRVAAAMAKNHPKGYIIKST